MNTATRPSPRYLSCAETAKLLRAALKRAFPGIKFGVRSSTYSMGASIYVSYTDGPSDERVKDLCNTFCGKNFDGMIDMAVSNTHWLHPDGTLRLAVNGGTEGSHGSISTEMYAPTHPEAELVHLGADYIFPQRQFSEAVMVKAVEELCAKFGIEHRPQVLECSGGFYAHDPANQRIGNEWVPTFLHRQMCRQDF